jgi:hypothetical protein
MGSHHDSTTVASRCQRKAGEIEERTLRSRFRMPHHGIGRQKQARLDGWQIEQMILLASHDEHAAGQIGHARSIAIEAIQTDEGVGSVGETGLACRHARR